MILFDSPILRLNYTPATDILVADLSNEHYFAAHELMENLNIILDHVRHYDIKFLLLDSRKRVLMMSELTYGDIMARFAQELQTTRLQKLARLQTNVKMRENLVLRLDAQIVSQYQFRTFYSIDEAIAWLTQKV